MLRSRILCFVLLIDVVMLFSSSAAFAEEFGMERLAGRKIVFLGDSITQDGRYVSLTHYYLERLNPSLQLDVYGLGLASETLSGLSELNHAGGRFPRPCLFERLGRLLDKLQPDVVFACYGINDGIYQPLDHQRFGAFQDGVRKLISQCRAAGVSQVVLITPPIFDASSKPGEFNYDSVMSEYAAWEQTLAARDVHVIDLHTVMRQARDMQQEPFSKDRVHPGNEGHLLIARTIISALGAVVPDESLTTIQDDPLYREVNQLRRLRSRGWMQHIGYTREKLVEPQPLGDTEAEASKSREKINALRRSN